MKNIEIISDDVVFSGKFLEMKQTLYTVNNDIFNWEYVSRKNNAKAVMIIAYNNGNLLLTSEYRVPLKGREIGFPAGLINEGENISNAISRELREETGLILDNIYEISNELFNSCGLTDETISIAFCSCHGKITDKLQEKQEDIKSFFITREDAKKILNGNEKIGAKTWLILKTFSDFGWKY